MPKPSSIKPTHKAVKQYYAALQSYRNHQVTHEGAFETAFGRLLEETAKAHGWKLIPKQRLKVGKSSVAPDGTLRDLFNMRCGFWEAKDTDDDLDAEIQKKIDKGYPLTNTIFAEPIRANVNWKDAEAMLAAFGAEISEGKGSRVRIALNNVPAVFHRPHPQKETDKGALRSLRRFL